MKKIILTIILLAIGYAGYHMVQKNGLLSIGGKESQSVWEDGTDEPVVVPILDSLNSNEYRDSARGFSFRYPNHLKATSFKDHVGDTILVQSAEKAQGFQITISPWDEPGAILTADMIQRDIPDLAVTNPQDLLLGESGKGVAFLSDNENFGGNSREVWFVFGGNLYQISTYARLDPLLQAVLSTWKFE
jgi:hypothetical protein